MKRIFYLLLILPILLSSCEIMPMAYFSVDKVKPFVGEVVFFTNESENSVRFEWDFGDGSFSDEANPAHIYTGSGSFQAELKAVSKSGLVSKAYQTIDVKIPTLLEIEVLEYVDHSPVENASVILYPTLADWDNEANSIVEGYTDGNGIVVFSGLGKFVYYADIWEAHHNNYTLRAEDYLFIRTPVVQPNQITRFVAYVDYVPGTKGENKRDRTMVIKSLVRKYQ